MLPNIKGIKTTEISKNESFATSPFGNKTQNDMCESIFLDQGNANDQKISREMIAMAKEAAKKAGSNVITESFKSPDGLSFSFDTEREADDCSGMEIAHYVGKIGGDVELTKNVFLKYISKNSEAFSKQDMQELNEARDDAKGALSILSALIETSDDKTKPLFQAKKEEVERYLAKYDNFFISQDKK